MSKEIRLEVCCQLKSEVACFQWKYLSLTYLMLAHTWLVWGQTHLSLASGHNNTCQCQDEVSPGSPGASVPAEEAEQHPWSPAHLEDSLSYPQKHVWLLVLCLESIGKFRTQNIYREQKPLQMWLNTACFFLHKLSFCDWHVPILTAQALVCKI